MKNKIKVLDCTLRDGGYVNNWEFSSESTINIIKALVKSKVELIECGFISQTNGVKEESTYFDDIGKVNEILNKIEVESSSSSFCVMINMGEYDLNTLPKYNGEKNKVSGIRYAFHKKDRYEAINDIKIIIEKGYEVYVQAMVTLSYNDQEILEFLDEVNKLDVYSMYIVDSFGAMFGDDFRRLHYLFENNLRKDILLGYHSHNNLQLAYSNAIDFIRIKNIHREIIIDSSIQGMGRGAGNLNTELFADYLNKKLNTDYNIVPLLDMIDKYLEVIYRENYWGYSIAHFLSASFDCHPNYATFLVNTKTLTIVDMQKILSQLTDIERKNYSKAKIEELYLEFKTETSLKSNLPLDFFKNKEVLIIASGPNSEIQKERVYDYIVSNNPIILAVNHIPKNYNSDYYFFSNQKRSDKFLKMIDNDKVIITSNLRLDTEKRYYVENFSQLIASTVNNNDNVTILLLQLLIKHNIKKVHIAGLDGYKFNDDNYSYKEFDRLYDEKALKKNNNELLTELKEIRKRIDIVFITDSMFK